MPNIGPLSQKIGKPWVIQDLKSDRRGVDKFTAEHPAVSEFLATENLSPEAIGAVYNYGEAHRSKSEFRLATLVLEASTRELLQVTQLADKTKPDDLNKPVKRETHKLPPFDVKISAARIQGKNGTLPATAPNIIGAHRELFDTDRTTQELIDHIATNSVLDENKHAPDMAIRGKAPNAVFVELRLGYQKDLMGQLNQAMTNINGVKAEQIKLPMALQAAIAQAKNAQSDRPTLIVTDVQSPLRLSEKIVVYGQKGRKIQLFDTSQLPKTSNATNMALVYPVNLTPKIKTVAID